METTKAAAKKAAKTKTAGQAASPATTATAPAQPAAAAAPEPLWHCEVIKINTDGTPFKIGSMNCGIGARTKLPKSKADALAADGWVKLLGIA